jgi:hypothetical protein
MVTMHTLTQCGDVLVPLTTGQTDELSGHGGHVTIVTQVRTRHPRAGLAPGGQGTVRDVGGTHRPGPVTIAVTVSR